VDNSLEILQGTSTDTITKQYGVLADEIKEYNGKTHVLNHISLQMTLYK
jgi:hypothetical protein